MIATENAWKELDRAFKLRLQADGDIRAYWRGYIEALRFCLELPRSDARAGSVE